MDAILAFENLAWKKVCNIVNKYRNLIEHFNIKSHLRCFCSNHFCCISLCQSKILYLMYFKRILRLLYVKFDEKANLHNLTTINLRISFLVRKCMEIFDFLSSEYWQSGHILNISINLETCYRTCWQSNRFPSFLHFKWFLG